MIFRTAFSLVEVLVTLSIGSTVLALSVGTVHQALQVAETAQHHGQQSLHSNRFFEQFRNDVHLGIAIQLQTNQSLTIELNDNTEIIYVVEKKHVTREQKVSDNKISRDAIALAENAYGIFDFDEASKLASLRILTKLERHHAPPRLNRSIEAILDHTASSYSIEEASP